MKKIFLSSFVLTFFVSCTCLPQISTQTIYANENCEAPLPDYTQLVTVSDNCSAILEQVPSPGYVLDIGHPSIDVTLRAVDPSGNTASTTFSVILLDTIPPTMEFPTSMREYTIKQIKGLYSVFEGYIQYNIADFMYNFNQFNEYGMVDSLYVFEHSIMLTDSLYNVYISSLPNE